MRLALDALEDFIYGDLSSTEAFKAINVLRAALAQQQAEPVVPWYRQFCNCPKCNESAKQAEPVADNEIGNPSY